MIKKTQCQLLLLQKIYFVPLYHLRCFSELFCLLLGHQWETVWLYQVSFHHQISTTVHIFVSKDEKNNIMLVGLNANSTTIFKSLSINQMRNFALGWIGMQFICWCLASLGGRKLCQLFTQCGYCWVCYFQTFHLQLNLLPPDIFKLLY